MSSTTEQQSKSSEDVSNVYLVQELVEHGPRGYETAYGSSYVTRAVCTSENAANKQLETLSEVDETSVFLLLKVPLDKVFPKGLPPGAEPPARPPYRFSKAQESETYQNSEEAEAHIAEHLQVPAETYELDRKIREAEMRQRLNVQPIPPPRLKQHSTQSN